MTKFQYNDLEGIKKWLTSAFTKNEFVNSVYLIGSVLHKHSKATNDIDVVQQIQFEKNSNLTNCIRTVNLIRGDFAKKFSSPLHITTFTQNELKEFKKFMNKNLYVKLI